jgi:hypothetical protein
MQKGKLINAMIKKINMDNYRFYLSARVQCFKSSEWYLLPYSFCRCIIWSHSRELDSLHLLRWCHPCSLFFQQFEVKYYLWKLVASCLVCMFVGLGLSHVGFLGSWQTPPLFCSKCVLLIEIRQRSSAWALLVEKHQ